MPTPLARVVMPLVMDLALLPSEMWFDQKVQGPNTKKPNTYLSSNFAKRKTGQERVKTHKNFFPPALTSTQGFWPPTLGTQELGAKAPSGQLHASLCAPLLLLHLPQVTSGFSCMV